MFYQTILIQFRGLQLKGTPQTGYLLWQNFSTGISLNRDGMDKLLDDLFAKRGAVREGALSSIIHSLSVNCRCQFAEKHFATILYRCLNSIKKGSSKEIVLAYRAIGLLAITVGCGDNADELYREMLPLISQALKSRAESVLLAAIDCLAIATFVGANNFEQTEASMQLIWHFIHSEPGETVQVKKHSASVMSSAISVWSLLLTTVSCWNLNQNHWQGAIPCFLDLLEVDGQSICKAASEAIALICEIGSLEKFGSNSTIDKISSMEKEKDIVNHDSPVQVLQDIISNHAKGLLKEISLQSAVMKSVNGWNNFDLNILKALEDGCFHETTLMIGKHSLEIHSLSQLLQVNFIKQFLGRGFVPHMLENEFLHDVFNFTPSKKLSMDELYSPEREEVVVHIFVSESQQEDSEENWWGMTHPPDRSAFCKAKTQLLNRKRDLKGEQMQSYNE